MDERLSSDTLCWDVMEKKWPRCKTQPCTDSDISYCIIKIQGEYAVPSYR